MSEAARYRVWDAPTRVFHWLLVVLIALQYASGEFHLLSMPMHYWLGYATLALLLFRLIWGFVGSQTSRFAHFLRGPAQVLRYARGTQAHEVGHNPLGGWSVLALIGSCLLQAISGLMSSDDIDECGPLCAHVSDTWVRRMSAIHAWNRYVLLALIAMHLIAVGFYLSRKHDLLAPMLHGRRALTADPQLRFARGWVAALIALACVFAVSMFMWWATLPK